MTTSKSSESHSCDESENKHFPTGFSQTATTDNAQWEDLLDRAGVYGIRDRDRLYFEADVGHMTDIGSRLVDNPPGRQNIDLWQILLVAQALQNGHDGIKAIWRGMKFRGEEFRFEGNDPQIDALWQTFLSAGAEDEKFLRSLYQQCKMSAFKRPGLFSEIVGAALEGRKPELASRFAASISQSHYRGREDLLRVFYAACHSTNANALRAFCDVYLVVPKTDIYTEVSSALWEQDRPTDAFMMHSFLVSKRDLPPRFELLEPYINHSVLHNESLDKFLTPLASAGVSFEAQARRLWARGRSRVDGVSAESLNIVASKTLGVSPNKPSDSFIARAFATQAFSFEFAVNSLRMIGLIEVGPLAIRQMVLTASDLDSLQTRFQKLQELEIDLGSSTFVRVLKNVCEAGRWEMVQALVHNDLHHEVFEDAELQERLLIEYYRKKDWLQLNRTLVILSDGHFDQHAQARSANLLLRSMMQVGDWAAAINLATSIQERGLSISKALAGRIRAIFDDTRNSTFARSGDMDRIAFLTGMLQNVVASGCATLKPKSWLDPLRALGRLGRLRELECLVYWIAEWYMPMGQVQARRVHKLFDEKFQKSLLSWCFRPHKGMRWMSPVRCLRWTRVLRRLRDVYGVAVKEHTIRWEFICRLRYLFAIKMRPTAHNASARIRNRTQLSRYWELYDKMWDMKPPGKVKYGDRNEIVLRYGKVPSWRARRRHLLRSPYPRPEQTARENDTRPDRQINLQENIVLYRDFFNASWEDHRN